jgi:hypothetical protein
LGQTCRNHVRLTFAKGASLKDARDVFNASLEGNTLRVDLDQNQMVAETNQRWLDVKELEQHRDRINADWRARP